MTVPLASVPIFERGTEHLIVTLIKTVPIGSAPIPQICTVQYNEGRESELTVTSTQQHSVSSSRLLSLEWVYYRRVRS